jgi:hypothetical protein
MPATERLTDGAAEGLGHGYAGRDTPELPGDPCRDQPAYPGGL